MVKEKTILESQIENSFIRKAVLCGASVYKVIAPAHRGFPDRLVMYKGQTYYIEFKSPKGVLSLHQEKFKNICEHHKLPYFLISSFDDVQAFFKELDNNEGL